MITSKISQDKLCVILIETFFIGLLATFLLNTAAYLFSMSVDIPQSNWGLLGRWADRIAHGHFLTPVISSEPSFPYEQAVGTLVHLLISFTFSFMYLLVCMQNSIRKVPSMISGLIFGLLLMVFPFFIEYPAMGMPVFNHQSPYVPLDSLRTVICHTFFGIGLGFGRLCLDYIRNSSVSTDML